ncbi:MAG TPA: dihydropteroate synthase [Rhizomicrobium sp.]|jgi:dihydropteroate synthase type 2
MKIFGILNITDDSFSDAGKYLAPEAAIAHARAMHKDGAAVIDIGAASSNPDSAGVPPDLEIARLASVVPVLRREGIVVSVDSFSPEVQRWALAQGVNYLNDIQGFPDADMYPSLEASSARLIVMHSVQERGPARRAHVPASEIFDRCIAFFEARLAALERAGIARDRLILDPGMGFFLGSDPEASFTMLRRLPELKRAFGLPLLVSVSRKSFLRRLTGRGPGDAGPASLAAELFAFLQGADYLRTHEPGPLKDVLTVWQALAETGGNLP